MMDRCYRLEDPRYDRYGGRDIKVMERWHEYYGFLKDMGCCPSEWGLDRIDSDKDYTPENCRWAPLQAQSKNKGKYSNNNSGVSGVHFCNTQHVWVAKGSIAGRRTQLYKGKDFFEACCARKSHELEVKRECEELAKKA